MKSIIMTDLLELRRADRAQMSAAEWFAFLQTTDATLEERQQEKIAALQEACEQAILVGFVSPTTGHRYNYTIYDQLNLMQQLVVMSHDTTQETIDWKTADAGLITHSRDEFLAVCLEADEHKRSKIATYRELKEQVAKTSTNQQLDDIIWPT